MRKSQAANKLKAVESRIKDLQTNLGSQFVDRRELPYHLHSVYMHRGGPTSGHYWIYIYDFAQKLWRKYNDNYVTRVDDISEIYSKDSLETRPATPYFLVYIKEGLESTLTDAVCRNPIEMAPDTEDLDMEEVIPSIEHNEYAGGSGFAQTQPPARPAAMEWDAAESNSFVDW